MSKSPKRSVVLAFFSVVASYAQYITTTQNDLSIEIKEINRLTKEITNVLKSLMQVNHKTRLIGVNASIEAARIGNEGRGFVIVAKEIQKLSEAIQETMTQIDDLNKRIDSKLDKTIKNSAQTLSATEDQSSSMEELSATLQASTRLAEDLKALFEIVK